MSKQTPELTVQKDALRGGDLLGEYVVEAELGRGGMGITYSCRNGKGERFALKVAGSEDSVEAREQLRRDLELACRVPPHPAVGQVFDLGEATVRGVRVTYLRCELVRGPSLATLLAKVGPLPIEAVRHLWVAVVEGLAVIHGAGVLHLDLKPGNILLDRPIDTKARLGPQLTDAMPKIIDFGISRERGDNAATSTGVEGTPYYMSPEQCEGLAPGPTSDLYTLGTTFFHVATGSPPFDGEQLAILHKQVTAPPPIAELEGRLGYHLSLILSRCLLKNPEARYTAPEQLLADLCLAGTRSFEHRELEYMRDHEQLNLTGKTSGPRKRPSSSERFERFQGESFAPLGQLLWLFSGLKETRLDVQRALDWMSEHVQRLRETLLDEPGRVSVELDVLRDVLAPRLRATADRLAPEAPAVSERLDELIHAISTLAQISGVRRRTLQESWQEARDSLAKLEPLTETQAHNRLVRVRVERDLEEKVGEVRWDLEEASAKIDALLEEGESDWAAQELLGFERHHPRAEALTELGDMLRALRERVRIAEGEAGRS
jgi:serine/threonine protein kinase